MSYGKTRLNPNLPGLAARAGSLNLNLSIRLRLTLLYSAILALTLIVFGAVLYFSQAQATFEDYKKTLADKAQTIDWKEQSSPPGPPLPADSPQSRPPESFYVQVRNREGEIVERDPNLGDTYVLPLSQAGLQVVRRNRPWEEIIWMQGERFLVRSQFANKPEGSDNIVQVAGSLARMDRYLSSLRNILIFGSGITVLAAFGMGWLLAGLALRPMKRITQTAHAIGDERDFARRVEHTGPKDEIGQLAITFNDMLAELQVAYQQVEQSLQAQRRFVADASHELRTPLTTLRGNLALLQREPPISDEDRLDVLTDTVNETERLMRLVAQLLVLARADARRSLPCQPLPLNLLIEDVCGQVKRLAPHRDIVCDLSSGATVTGNADALKQVLLILLDNALKHTPLEASITITTSMAEDSVAVYVSDTGPGIEPAQLAHIFDRFYRGDAARTGEGAGLGLAIAKELMQAQGGTLTVESQVGQGSVFTFTLPPSNDVRASVSGSPQPPGFRLPRSLLLI